MSVRAQSRTQDLLLGNQWVSPAFLTETSVQPDNVQILSIFRQLFLFFDFTVDYLKNGIHVLHQWRIVKCFGGNTRKDKHEHVIFKRR